MMRKLYLHIGMHKTATTSLQFFCSTNRRWLIKHRIFYPDMGSNNHRLWGMHLSYGQKAALEQSIKLWNSSLKPQMDEHPDCDVLLSYEGLWSLARQEVQGQPWRCALLREWLQDFEVHLIAYLRRQDSWCESMYNQQVKTYVHTGDIQTFVDEHIKSLLLDYRWIASFWKEQMGVNKLHFSVFEPEQWYNGSIFADFLRHLGLPASEGLPQLMPERNKSLSPAGVALKRKLNPYLKVGWRNNIAKGVVQALQPVLSRRDAHLLPYPEALRIENIFAKSNRQVAQEILGRQDGILFRHPVAAQPAWEYYPLSST